MREKLQVKGFTKDTIDIILSSWRDGTKSQYQSVAKRWFEFCEKNECDAISPTLPLALGFLSELFNSGLSYSYINTARSALSSILCCNNTSIPFGQLPIVKRFMKGVFETRPSLPRYSSTWDINIAFNYIRQQKPLSLLSLKDLSHRVAFLLCLLSGQRCQTLSKLSIENMTIDQSTVTFIITEKLKHTRVGAHQEPLQFLAYPPDRNLCIVAHLTEYLQKTSPLRGDNKQLFISFIRPHQPVSKDTISNWIKNFMTSAGIDTSKYTTHSTRATFL